MPIPARFYFYWSGEGFSFLNYLSVYSLLRTTTGITCEVHFDREPPPGNRYWTLLRATSGVSLRKVDFPELLQDSNMTEAQKSDLFRYLVLLPKGGVYSDFDVIFVRDFRPLLHDEFLVGFQISTQYRQLINTAVLGASAQSPVLRIALDEATRLLQNHRKLEWGDLGPDLMTRILVNDCPRNKALVRCAKIARKLHFGKTVADDMLFRFLRTNHDVTIHHRDCFYYRSWLDGDWERILDDPYLPSKACAVHLWHKVSAGVMDAIDETNFREKISNPVLRTLCEDFVAGHS